jgi:hypothetical protein
LTRALETAKVPPMGKTKTSSGAEAKARRALEANKQAIGKTKRGTPSSRTLEARARNSSRGKARDWH